MSNKYQNNPYDSFRRVSEVLEKGYNDLLFQSIDNNPLIQVTKVGLDLNARYIEILKRNREIMAAYMNLPTKRDVANAVKQTIQAEEKIDLLEEQIWKLQENFAAATTEQNKLLGELLEFTKQIHSEWQKASKDLAQLSEMKNQFDQLNELMNKGATKPELVGTTS